MTAKQLHAPNESLPHTIRGSGQYSAASPRSRVEDFVRVDAAAV